ncbi:G-type lectin S-receptor-like serine/threonine-protein kinase, partial [Mucuna pruriens]
MYITKTKRLEEMSCLSSANDTITSAQFITDPHTLISANGVFKLGFFSPLNSSNRYVGIWYLSHSDAIWIANRNQPLTNNSSGLVQISADGNLVVLDSNKRVVWSSNVTGVAINSTAKLLETGNLVLLDGATGQTIWESFQHPSHALVPKMKFGINKRTGENIRITSWRSPSDPSLGYYSATLERPNIPEMFYWFNETQPYHRSGPWNNQIFIGSPEMSPGYLNGWSMVNDADDDTIYLSYNLPNQSYFGIMTLNPQGQIVCSWWINEKLVQRMVMERTSCDLYGYCGAFGSCNSQSSPICSCLSGYKPKNGEEWNRKNWTSGCVRSEPLQCGTHTNGSTALTDEFLKLENMKVPDFVQRSASLDDECRAECLENCSCMAYAYDSGGIGCMVWSGDLIDMQKFSSGGVDLYIRVPPSEHGKIYSLRQRMNENQKQKLRDQLPLFSFEDLVTATNNFHSANVLGKGGFGSVYKGHMKDGQETAVKRLSKTSGQGLEECMNEVLVISKLQHRNLVRLLGCCIEKEENMLVYEYMPNKSLDVSNILLDGELNPKISDFGMARIFGGNDIQANTRRIVGTFGYMPPEYAFRGLVSEKLDVFSFGVLLLEIISGRKISSYYDQDQSLSLLGFAWKLWNEKELQSLIDPEICNPNNVNDIVRCIHIGLLCLQNLSEERPIMATVVSMLNSEIVNLPRPSQPAFVQGQIVSCAEPSHQNHRTHSINNVTVTNMQEVNAELRFCFIGILVGSDSLHFI